MNYVRTWNPILRGKCDYVEFPPPLIPPKTLSSPCGLPWSVAAPRAPIEYLRKMCWVWTEKTRHSIIYARSRLVLPAKVLKSVGALLIASQSLAVYVYVALCAHIKVRMTGTRQNPLAETNDPKRHGTRDFHIAHRPGGDGNGGCAATDDPKYVHHTIKVRNERERKIYSLRNQ